MKNLIQLEELAKLLLACWASLGLDYAWWAFYAWFLVPDLSMLAYLINTRVGAWAYNLFHHQAFAIGLGVLGWVLQLPALQLAGLVLFGHSAFDRMLGYGLKHEDDFKHTHLGWIGRQKMGA